MISIISSHSLYAEKSTTIKLSKQEEVVVLNSCMDLHKKRSNKKEICQCVIKNLNQSLYDEKERTFIVKYYAKKTKLECGEFEMLCSGDFHIASSCSKDIKYNLSDPSSNHSHSD
jgi:hypothetical protein